MNKRKVVAIAIDAPNQQHLNDWLEAGELPTVARISRQGIKVVHSHKKLYRNERCWNTFLSGVEVGGTGSRFDPISYRYSHVSIQHETHPLFYELGKGTRVCQFDFPAPLGSSVDGIQITGWGSELNAAHPMSFPPGLVEELIKKHGDDPKMKRSFTVMDCQGGERERSFRTPNLYRPEGLRQLYEDLRLSVKRRTDICLDLLSREQWDLFLALFVESHTANHLLWHTTHKYPVTSALPNASDPLLGIMREIDEGIGRIEASLSSDTILTIFTVDDTTHNCMDLPSMALLPELLFRWNYLGTAAVGWGIAGEQLPPPRSDFIDHWKNEVWRMTTPRGREVLMSPMQLEEEGEALCWNPAMWYQGLWPSMRAFALASVSDGFIRVNVEGRESQGIVAQEDFHKVLAELCSELRQLIDPRNGKPVVERVDITRSNPYDQPEIPPDLIVCWREDNAFDAIESPRLGRIGPLPFFRSGGHRAHGSQIKNILVARGSGITPGGEAPPGQLVDVPCTLLSMMGVEAPYLLAGRPLFRLESRC